MFLYRGRIPKTFYAIIVFVNDGGVVKISIVAVGPSMIGDPGSFNRCFYIVQTRVFFFLVVNASASFSNIAPRGVAAWNFVNNFR